MADIQQAIAAIKAGDRAIGKQLLIEVLKANSDDESAWLWMTQVVSISQERLRYLQNVLKINPNNLEVLTRLWYTWRYGNAHPAHQTLSAPTSI